MFFWCPDKYEIDVLLNDQFVVFSYSLRRVLCVYVVEGLAFRTVNLFLADRNTQLAFNCKGLPKSSWNFILEHCKTHIYDVKLSISLALQVEIEEVAVLPTSNASLGYLLGNRLRGIIAIFLEKQRSFFHLLSGCICYLRHVLKALKHGRFWHQFCKHSQQGTCARTDVYNMRGILQILQHTRRNHHVYGETCDLSPLLDWDEDLPHFGLNR
mmetsp:Transcript_95953/g.185065  ORF Transcript_95953/g.185065 Transcript_95953/m.185065 type:complete len:212 (-) Transcript_95953:236-871(-)